MGIERTDRTERLRLMDATKAGTSTMTTDDAVRIAQGFMTSSIGDRELCALAHRRWDKLQTSDSWDLVIISIDNNIRAISRLDDWADTDMDNINDLLELRSFCTVQWLYCELGVGR